MTRENFERLHGLIKNHPVFGPTKTERKRPGPKTDTTLQLMTLLHYLGHHSITASATRGVFMVGYGTRYFYIRRPAKAIASLRHEVVYWPDAEERKEIAGRMAKKYDFPHCVMMGDGTLSPLENQPHSEDALDYHAHK